ncbi:MAG: acetyl-CoA carboxylase biotin carboxyl carrier protein [Leptolyngbyaceae bacterium]|nr:acetyl-CoA carboxylase biotin carboxyl carrier protein [Leptolyngbyaceae bacterium]
MDLSFSDLRDLLTTIDQTDIAELDLKSENWELSIRKLTQGAVVVPPSVAGAPVASPPLGTAAATNLAPAPAASAAPAASPPPPMADRKLLEITSPMVGTFYRAPAPEEAPFVSVGDRISTGNTVCIIEAMKLMNELESEVSGTIVEILVENAQPIEFGQVLMRVDPG